MKKILAVPAAAAAALALALTGCASEAGTEAAGGLQIDVPDIAMMDKLGDNEKEVNILAWSGFVEPAWSEAFTQ